MNQFFPHERLDVYAEALAFVQMTVPLTAAWPATASIRDQLDRAGESLITNLVRAVRLGRTRQGIYFLECSLGSALECAACLDVAVTRRFLDLSQLRTGKQNLQAIARMEIGLRSLWRSSVHEEAEPYAAQPEIYFAHESLQVYQRAIELYEVLAMSIFDGDKNCHRYARRIDELATSVVLNIAEGNGRFSHLDHGKFIDIAEDCGIKLAAYLDLGASAWSIDMAPAKSLLREIMAMLTGLKGYLKNGSKQ